MASDSSSEWELVTPTDITVGDVIRYTPHLWFDPHICTVKQIEDDDLDLLVHVDREPPYSVWRIPKDATDIQKQIAAVSDGR